MKRKLFIAVLAMWLAASPQFAQVPNGDANGDGLLTAADALHIIAHLFGGAPAPVQATDPNGDGSVSILDVFYLLNHLFTAGPPPVFLAPPNMGLSLENERAASADVGQSERVLSVTAANGTQFTLMFPAGSVPSTTTVTATPLSPTSQIPVGGQLIGGIHLQPEGTAFAAPVTVTMTPPAGVAFGEVFAFAYRANGESFSLLPFNSNGFNMTVTITHFSGVGAAAGASAPCAVLTGSGLPPREAAQQEIACILNRAGLRSDLAPADWQQIENAFASWFELSVYLDLDAAERCWGTDCPTRKAMLTESIGAFVQWTVEIDDLYTTPPERLNLLEAVGRRAVADLLGVAQTSSENACVATTDHLAKIAHVEYMVWLQFWVDSLGYPELDSLTRPDQYGAELCGFVFIEPTSASLSVNENRSFVATVTDVFGNEMDAAPVSWTIDPTTVAEFTGSPTGRTVYVHTIGAGNATLTASSDRKKGSVQITVESAASAASIQLDPTEFLLAVDESFPITATVRGHSGEILVNPAVTWSSSAPGIAEVSNAGVAMARRLGVAELTATVIFDGAVYTATSRVTTFVNIPDPNLNTAIRQTLGLGPTEVIGGQRAASLNSLNRSHAGIANLQGLQHFENLEVLMLRSNAISDLSPLAAHPRLRVLDLLGNQISDLTPIASATALAELNVAYNNISRVAPLAGMVTLQKLSVTRNLLTDLSSLAGMSSLLELSAVSSGTTNINFVSSLTNLQFLELSDNRIADISPVANLHRLERLVLDRMPEVVDLSPIASLTNLWQLKLGGRWEGNLKVLATWTDLTPLASLTKLRYLHVSISRVSDISALAGLVNLEGVSLDFNEIVDITPLRSLPNVTSIGLWSNRIQDIQPLLDNPGVSSGDGLRIRDNDLATIFVSATAPHYITSCGTYPYSCDKIRQLVARGVIVDWDRQRIPTCEDRNGDGVPETAVLGGVNYPLTVAHCTIP